MAEQTINELLASHGYSKRRAAGTRGACGVYDIISSAGKIIFSGNAYQVANWLRQEGASDGIHTAAQV